MGVVSGLSRQGARCPGGRGMVMRLSDSSTGVHVPALRPVSGIAITIAVLCAVMAVSTDVLAFWVARNMTSSVPQVCSVAACYDVVPPRDEMLAMVGMATALTWVFAGLGVALAALVATVVPMPYPSTTGTTVALVVSASGSTAHPVSPPRRSRRSRRSSCRAGRASGRCRRRRRCGGDHRRGERETGDENRRDTPAEMRRGTVIEPHDGSFGRRPRVDRQSTCARAVRGRWCCGRPRLVADGASAGAQPMGRRPPM